MNVIPLLFLGSQTASSTYSLVSIDKIYLSCFINRLAVDQHCFLFSTFIIFFTLGYNGLLIISGRHNLHLDSATDTGSTLERIILLFNPKIQKEFCGKK